jgi:amino acid adenylation domain-containing protein
MHVGGPEGLRRLELDEDGRPLDAVGLELPVAAPPDDVAARRLAYVIYTSGTTGEPRGVMVEHRSVCNLVEWHRETFAVGPGSRTSCTAGVAFDAMAWETWSALCVGACLVMPPTRSRASVTALLNWWAREKLDVSFLVTPLAELACATGRVNASCRVLLVGGDRLRSRLALPGSCHLVNNYGPTEATVVATSGIVGASDDVLHVGKPIANTRIYILDAGGEPVAIGETGEIHIGGVGVARGYLNQPELTRQRFMRDTFSDEPYARMYGTGDLGRWLQDGRIEFIGRQDGQIKVRGYRIELGEIEACLACVPSVRGVAVAAHEDAVGGVMLVAYVVPPDDAALDIPALEAACAVLPPYMIPDRFVARGELPFTVNGKIDRRALRPD